MGFSLQLINVDKIRCKIKMQQDLKPLERNPDLVLPGMFIMALKTPLGITAQTLTMITVK